MNRIFRFFESRVPPYPKGDLDFSRNSVLGFLWACTEGVRPWLCLFIITTAGIGAYEALLFAWVGDLVDWLGQYSAAELWQLKGNSLIMMGAVLALSPFWVLIGAIIHFQVLQGVFPMRLRWRFHGHMLGQSAQFYQDEFSGRISTKVMQTALAVRATIITFGEMFVYVIVYFIGSGLILASLDILLLLPFMLWLLMFGCTLVYFLPKLQEASSRQADARSLMTGRVTDAYANITTVKLFSHSKREMAYAKNAMEQFLATVHTQMRWITKLEVANHVTSVTLIGSTTIISLYLWQDSIITVGAIASATAMAIRLNGLTHWIMWQTATLFENIGIVHDGMRTLSLPYGVKDNADAGELSVTQGKISFEQVGFNYQAEKFVKARNKSKQTTTNKVDVNTNNNHKKDDKDNAKDNSEASVTTGDNIIESLSVFDDFNLNIRAGEKVGLIGQSGAGKSTLINLLLRFYDVQSGQITIDGQDIKTVTQDSLRQQVGMVTQDTSLLHRTIRENIAYGHPDATDEQIIAATKQAHAWEFIQELSDNKGNTGLDTQVGERGVKLSGGQRQRIAIARVMLKNAPILLLDEATSALDSEVEYAITQSLHDMMTGKTVIAIAHRLSTIAELDRLIVIDNGKIAEQGSHEELLAIDGLYAKLWQRQSGGFLGE